MAETMRKEKTSNTGQSYGDYYGDYYHKKHTSGGVA